MNPGNLPLLGLYSCGSSKAHKTLAKEGGLDEPGPVPCFSQMMEMRLREGENDLPKVTYRGFPFQFSPLFV